MARNFSGTNQNLKVLSAVVSAYPFSAAGWFNKDSITTGTDLIDINKGTVNTDAWRLIAAGDIAGDPLRFVSRTASVSVLADTTTGFSASTWHHGGMVGASATDRTVYLDGGSAGTNTTSNTPTGLDRVTFGERGDGSADYAGLLAEWAVWNVALTAAEFVLLAKGIHSWKVRPADIVAYWPLWGRNSPEPDYVGGFNLTVTGATQVAHPPKAQMLWLPTSRGVFVPVAGAGLAGHGLLLSSKRNRLVQMAA